MAKRQRLMFGGFVVRKNDPDHFRILWGLAREGILRVRDESPLLFEEQQKYCNMSMEAIDVMEKMDFLKGLKLENRAVSGVAPETAQTTTH